LPENKKMDSVQKVNKNKVEAERARLKKAGLRQVGFHIAPDLWKRFKLKVIRDRLTITQVATAMIELFVRGGFNVEKTSDQADKK